MTLIILARQIAPPPQAGSASHPVFARAPAAAKILAKGNRNVAKKRAGKKVVKKRPSKPAAPVAAAPKIVVFFELSDVAGVRFHSEFADIERARIAAKSLVSSPDVAQAWIVRDLEIVRKPSG